MRNRKIFNWGILATGGISNDFTNCLLNLPKISNVSAVGARTLKSAQNFAKQRKIPNAYGSYKELAQDKNIDVVYIGSIHPFHKEHCLMCLDEGKHVVVEKPIALNASDAKEITDFAKQKKLFLTENVWTNYFPIFRKALQIARSGEIGEIQVVQSDFGINFPADADRIWNPQMGGGAALDIGLYPVSIVQAFLGKGKQIEQINCFGKMGTKQKENVDIMGNISVLYPDNKLGVAGFNATANTQEETHIIGTKGKITISFPSHCPTHMTIKKQTGYADKPEVQYITHELPQHAKEFQYNCFNSEGFVYAIENYTKAIIEGKLEMEEYSHNDTLSVMKILDKFRSDIGYSYPQEKQQKKTRQSENVVLGTQQKQQSLII